MYSADEILQRCREDLKVEIEKLRTQFESIPSDARADDGGSQLPAAEPDVIFEHYVGALREQGKNVQSVIRQAVNAPEAKIGTDYVKIADDVFVTIHSELQNDLIRISQNRAKTSAYEKERDEIRKQLQIEVRNDEGERNRRRYFPNGGIDPVYEQMLEWILAIEETSTKWPTRDDFETNFLETGVLLDKIGVDGFVKQATATPTLKGLLLSNQGVRLIHILQRSLDGLYLLLSDGSGKQRSLQDLQRAGNLSAQDAEVVLPYLNEASVFHIFGVHPEQQYTFTISRSNLQLCRTFEELLDRSGLFKVNIQNGYPGRAESGQRPEFKKNRLRGTFGEYTIRKGKPAGTGAVAVVRKALDEKGNPCAIKQLNITPHTTTKTRRRFRKEFRFLFSTTHKNIVGVHDFAPCETAKGEQSWFYVMDLYDGNLRSLMPILQSDPALILSVVFQMIEGLEAAHHERVWHRDLKPENILFRKLKDSYEIALSDFGAAHIYFNEDGQPELTETGDWLGNKKYASPEQLDGQPGDWRSDIYSLGLLLHEMFTGKVVRAPNEPPSIESISPPYRQLDELSNSMRRHDNEARPQSIEEIKDWLVQHSFLTPTKATSQISNSTMSIKTFKAVSLPMDVIGTFQRDRINLFRSDDWPIPMDGSSALMVHLIPENFVSKKSPEFDPTKEDDSIRQLWPIDANGWSDQTTIEGLIRLSKAKNRPGKFSTYLQIFRTWVIESCSTGILAIYKDPPAIGLLYCEAEIVRLIKRALAVYKAYEIRPPIGVVITYLGIKGYRLSNTDGTYLYDRNDILLPPIVIADFGDRPEVLMKSSFDLMWQAVNVRQSDSYDNYGNWTNDRY